MIKVQKLNESAADAKSRVGNVKPGKKDIGPLEAWDKSRNVKEMDDAAAWAINERTNSSLGDSLQNVLKPSTLSKFIRAISWKDLYSEDTDFVNFLIKNKNNIVNTLEKGNQWSEEIKDSNLSDVEKATMLNSSKSFSSADSIFQELYNGSLSGIYPSDSKSDEAFKSCLLKKDVTDKKMSNEKQEVNKSPEEVLKTMSKVDKQKYYDSLKKDKDVKK